jgi:hypothetical protein
VYEVIQRQNNALIHGSPTGYRQVLMPRPEGKSTINRIGPDTRWLDSLGHGVLGSYVVCKGWRRSSASTRRSGTG